VPTQGAAVECQNDAGLEILVVTKLDAAMQVDDSID
jgi:hypothetical protein